jgi:hypothetical protein
MVCCNSDSSQTLRSLVTHVEIDAALKSHDCQGNPKHRIARGDARLKVREGRSWDHYCVACARNIIQRDIVTLQSVADGLRAGAALDATMRIEAAVS